MFVVQTVDWVTKLDGQLYPVLGSNQTSAKGNVQDLEGTRERTLAEIKRAQDEVQLRITTAEKILSQGEVFIYTYLFLRKKKMVIISFVNKLLSLGNQLIWVIYIQLYFTDIQYTPDILKIWCHGCNGRRKLWLVYKKAKNMLLTR